MLIAIPVQHAYPIWILYNYFHSLFLIVGKEFLINIILLASVKHSHIRRCVKDVRRLISFYTCRSGIEKKIYVYLYTIRAEYRG